MTNITESAKEYTEAIIQEIRNGRLTLDAANNIVKADSLELQYKVSMQDGTITYRTSERSWSPKIGKRNINKIIKAAS